MTYSSYFLITELNKGKEVKLMDVLVVNEEPLSDIAEGGTIVEGGDRLGICTCDKKIVRVNMLFFNECYILAYQCKYWGITKGQKLGISLDTILSPKLPGKRHYPYFSYELLKIKSCFIFIYL